MADGPCLEQNELEVREVATKVVEDIIQRATIEANDRQDDGLPSFPVLPTIQIDVVASRTPSPDSLTDDTTGDTCLENTNMKDKSKVKPGKTAAEKEKTAAERSKETKYLREFSRLYLQEVFSKAVQVAEERQRQKMGTMKMEEGIHVKKSPASPWYIRVGESLVRFIRIACLCGGRRNNS